MGATTRLDPADGRVRTANPATLRALERAAQGPGKVISIFVNLDPSSFATAPARDSEIRSLINDVARMVEQEEDHDDREQVHADLELLKAYFGSTAVPFSDAKGLAVYVSSPRELFDVVRLPVAPQPEAEIGDAPQLGPLAPYMTETRWGVLLVNRETSRFLFGPAHRLREVDRFEDEVHGRHKQGGWSQARYQRSVERDVEIHLDRVAGRIDELHEKFAFDHLAIAAPKELVAQVEEKLPDQVRRRVAGHLHLDVERATPEEVTDELAPLDRRVRAERERALLDRWATERGNNGRAAAGFDEVMAALREKRVDTILIREDVDLPEQMVDLALEQSASIVVLEADGDALAEPATQGIGALLRWGNA